MNIDWFTFSAQIANFLVLVALLRRYLYGPIVQAMQDREEKIANRLQEADQKRRESEERVSEFEKKSREIEQKRDDLLQNAREEAEKERQRLRKEAKQEIDRRREQWQDALQREKEDILSEFQRQAGEMGLRIARRTLQQLADAELEDRMYNAFASRLTQLGDEERQDLLRHTENGQPEVSVSTSFDISNGQRERLRETIQQALEAEADVSFEHSSDLLCGLEMNVGGQSFGWNINDFLHDLELDFSERLKQQH